MAITLTQTEAIPATYAEVTPYPHHHRFDPLPEEAQIEPALIWQRLEAFMAHRFSARAVVWLVEGPGDWAPPLTPAEITAVEVWANEAWTATAPPSSPLGGYVLPGFGPYRVTATVGGGDVPEAVQEAWRRLHEYSRGVAEQFRNDAAFRTDQVGEITSSWAGKALYICGAADLLRPYRRA